ncbi:o-succinylbenzoate--CoA ligase [Rhodococcus sp. SORGH_AS_0303]|uniref:o-succinylbenzoate--CoA ligase n=1 Tax=Rhodococcus sp. SORGH_AS_0303 TaxID=3041753 RepID=UPI002782FDC5|nr:o-succinylbenzoate--CoA ligase [Rhodococcus sp. SORGH_AS_0303]MDQ1200141.1 O-succinylbenzoic acid--CoA ligase [Rhodococcus sp. SORGH_AS_0303]
MADLTVLPVPSGDAVLGLLPRLRAVLDGTAEPVLPVPADDDRERRRLADALSPGTPAEPGTAMVLATSGSTGTPKGALLGAAALRASAAATHTRLGGPGQWLLALPAHHIAGMQVVLRSLAAGHEPAVVDVSTGFDPAHLVRAVASMSGPRRYTSLVPTQMVKALDRPDAVAALASLDAVLLGGAATPAPVLDRALAAGITVVRTYGMSETCGGCVYDGVPLDGVTVGLEADGRVRLGGPTLANGYRGMPDHPAFAEAGWFRTDDLGRLQGDRLQILGRADDAITTGGLTVVPRVVEDAVAGIDGVAECVVVGVPDPRLGERVGALVVLRPGVELSPESLRAAVADALGPAAAPRQVLFVDALPARGPGKVDRAAARTTLVACGPTE